MNIQKIAIELGDIVKWTGTEKDIDRKGQAILRVAKENFPNDFIKSVRQQAIYNWLCSLGKISLESEERTKRLVDFSFSISNIEDRQKILEILASGGVSQNVLFKDKLNKLTNEKLHPEVYKHAKDSYLYEKYAHAILEVCKAYDKAIQSKSGLDKSGRSLMQEAWAWRSSVLRVTAGDTDSDEKYHEGIKLLSEGVMAGVRNITAHEPILDWPINEEDCLDILRLLSYLFRKLDVSVKVR